MFISLEERVRSYFKLRDTTIDLQKQIADLEQKEQEFSEVMAKQKQYQTADYLNEFLKIKYNLQLYKSKIEEAKEAIKEAKVPVIEAFENFPNITFAIQKEKNSTSFYDVTYEDGELKQSESYTRLN